jgi:hypothetical protein
MTNEDFMAIEVIADMAASLLAAVAIVLSVWIYYKIRREKAYENFDITYLDLLKIAMDYPMFRDANVTLNYNEELEGELLIRYKIYAFMCWNFCETIVDRGDKNLLETWNVVIETENKLHRRWFDEYENHDKFKASFRKYINQKLPTPYLQDT